MKLLILTACWLIGCMAVTAQNPIADLLASIEARNLTLKTLRAKVEAKQAEQTASRRLADPEVGIHYLWGSPAPVGNRTDVSVSQTLDMPTLLGAQGKLGKEQRRLAAEQYRQERIAILLEAKLLALDVIYCNLYLDVLRTRQTYADSLRIATAKRLSAGDMSLLSANKAQFSASLITAQILRVETERETLLTQLTRLNNNETVCLTEQTYPPESLPLDFEAWTVEAVPTHPLLGEARENLAVKQRQLSLTQIARLPSLSVGYMSEKVAGEHFQGVSVSISLPLWSSQSKIKQAKAELYVAKLQCDDALQHVVSKGWQLYEQTLGLKRTADTYREAIRAMSSIPLLQRALQAGEISQTDYWVELSAYYEAYDRLLETERDYRHSLAQLQIAKL